MNVGDTVIHEGWRYVVRVVKLNRIVLADPDGVRETIAVKPGLLAADAVTTVLAGVEMARIGEGDEAWSCPVPDVTTIAAHLKLLHGIELRGLDMTEDQMLIHHRKLHGGPFTQPPTPHVHQ